MTKSILVVDDDPRVLKLVCVILSKVGHNVITAANGEQGLAIFLHRKQAISLVVTDLDMPVMDGHALAVAVQDLDERIPVLLMSGRELELPPPFAFIPKPFSPADLLKAVGGALDGGPTVAASMSSLDETSDESIG